MNNVKPWVRIVIVAAGVVTIGIVAQQLSGSFLPSSPQDALLFQGALLLVVLGSALLEEKYTRPADAVVNGLVGLISLFTVRHVAPQTLWNVVTLYSAFVLVISTGCVIVSAGPTIRGWRKAIASITYRPSVILGQARVIYSVVFLFGIFAFYLEQTASIALLVACWGIYVVLWPLRIPELLSSLGTRTSTSIGTVLRTDNPNIVRVALSPSIVWHPSSPKAWLRSDGKCFLLVPLYSQVQDDRIIGTAHASEYRFEIPGLTRGGVFEIPSDLSLSERQVTCQLGGMESSILVGVIRENSDIAEIRFETWDDKECVEDAIVWCRARGKQVYYQVAGVSTAEEPLENDRRGFQVATGAQLGVIVADEGFKRYPWVPPMNSPVFIEAGDFGTDLSTTKPEDFVFGTIPGTKLKVGGPLIENLSHHTAILGVTGSGKTELGFDIIRAAVERDRKVICIDLTARYETKLAELTPVDLSIAGELAADLGDKLLDVETGQYGAGPERKVLSEFAARLRDDISTRIEGFLTFGTGSLGIIKLEEISNTKATLFITEIYLTCLLHFARDRPDECPEVLIVVEEAHTVMPEPSTMGLGDFDSRGLVGKIAQIALQGRKYGVGLLVIAQRTATVTKTVLTQCNTIVSLSCFDDTSLGFLRNVLGSENTSRIPRLQFLHAMVYGKGVRSELPVVAAIPFVASKL